MESVNDILIRHESVVRAKIDELRIETRSLELELERITAARYALSNNTFDTEHEYKGSRSSRNAVRYFDNIKQRAPVEITSSESSSRPIIKEMIVSALLVEFPKGANASELLDYISHSWGRPDIVRTSFSPQLSRLKHEGLIEQDGLIWKLTPFGRSMISKA